jgi:hypothetical protein
VLHSLSGLTTSTHRGAVNCEAFRQPTDYSTTRVSESVGSGNGNMAARVLQSCTTAGTVMWSQLSLFRR